MTLRPIIGLAAGLLACGPAFAQTITPAMLRERIAVLASDAYEGRQPGTPGGQRTEAYILQAFADAGLRPGAPDGGWRHEISLTRSTAGATTGSIMRAGRTVPVTGLVAIGVTPQTRVVQAPLVYLGKLDAAAMAKAPVRGRVAVVELAGDRDARLQALQDAGAAGAIFLAPAAMSATALQERFGSSVARASAVRPALVGYAGDGVAAALLGADAANLRKRADGADFAAVAVDGTLDIATTTERRTFTTANIVGMIPGAARPNEAVMLSAHWDHLGYCRPEGAADRICNGAADNASGTAILIEAARVLAAQPATPRSIYFVATTAEEMGLIGADAYAEAVAATPLKIVANLNIDTTAIIPAGTPVAIVGRGNHPAIDAIVDATARAMGRAVDTDTQANIMVQRQDGWAFGKRGIPAVMATGSVSDMKRLFAYLDGPYHKPDDDLAHIELAGAAEDADLHVALARALADPARYPAN